MHKALSACLTISMLGLASTTLATGPASATAERTPTAYALKASGYGTRLIGGQVPAGSGTTAFEAIGCTNIAGTVHENHVTDATLPGVGTAHEITSREWTTHRGDIVASHSRSSVEQIVVGDATTLGTLAINAVRTVVSARHAPDGFHVKTHSSIGSLSYTDPSGQTQSVDAPTPGQPVTIPGLATVDLGRDGSTQGDHSARAVADALRLTMTASGTRLIVAHSTASVGEDVHHGLFHGRSSGISSSDALDHNASVGEQPLTLMPCQGTAGKVHAKDLAALDLDGGLAVQGLHSSQQADQTRKAAFGQAIGQVASVDLGGGQLVVDAIKGVANVRRTSEGLTTSIKGSSIGSITVNGEEQTFPPSDVIEIPGVARLERDVVEKLRYGISVVALRLTLLDGTGATVDLGAAQLSVKPIRH